MRRTAFVPARSSRHRASALALYRALLRSAVKCDNVGSNNDGEIKSVITSQFRKNTTYTSSRLTYAAMVAGYKVISPLLLNCVDNGANLFSILHFFSEQRMFNQ